VQWVEGMNFCDEYLRICVIVRIISKNIVLQISFMHVFNLISAGELTCGTKVTTGIAVSHKSNT
jgi:hypothetical protein